ncbi:hypothetical protein A2165_04375 [Candidatus Curtissbacteria bacterium RBG_13_40_7]|uniref:Polymerase nucleotidyl transferase domain-containing protein n=1 Tax=Candidatus Curtissbacteria bacterium RBG_13_40_7 TaxID=1797706 RepID=A0A1F5FYS0_9BACT|nr:MAG: hypothetical protein A2165_04375 [Candidatus Curtissbacteria bacterium RBG_13_40_7]
MQREIQDITNQIVQKYQPEKIILFGSAARGEFDPEKSDLDFFVVKNDRRSIHKRMITLYRLVEKKLPADFLVYTPKELETRLKLGDPFIKSIFEEGKLLYG